MRAATSSSERSPIPLDARDLNSTIVAAVDGPGSAPFQRTLSDSVLLQICRVADDDPQLTREWLIQLRIVPLLVGSPQNAHLEPAMTWLASVLGLLSQFNPTHLPFGYTGPRVQSRGWVDRDALERVGKQIVGLMRPQMPAEKVATAVQDAVSASIRLGFMEEQQYDAWRPGMRSGSGWRSAVATTPYGASRACLAEDVGSAGHDSDAGPISADSPRGIAAAERIVEPSPEQDPGPAAAGTVDRPIVQLGRRGEPCFVLGQPKKPPTDAEYAILAALIAAGEEGLNKDAMEAVRASARRILKRLCGDPDWARVILLPGQTNGRYRIRT